MASLPPCLVDSQECLRDDGHIRTGYRPLSSVPYLWINECVLQFIFLLHFLHQSWSIFNIPGLTYKIVCLELPASPNSCALQAEHEFNNEVFFSWKAALSQQLDKQLPGRKCIEMCFFLMSFVANPEWLYSILRFCTQADKYLHCIQK